MRNNIEDIEVVERGKSDCGKERGEEIIRIMMAENLTLSDLSKNKHKTIENDTDIERCVESG